MTGNPVRPSVIAAAAIPYPEIVGRRLNVLVTGGSQGARVMADVVPAALALLAPDERQWIRLTQQARGEDNSRVAAACARMSFPVEIAEFFADLPARIASRASRHRPRRRFDRLRACGHRPRFRPRAVPARARSGSGGERGGARRIRRRGRRAAARIHPRAAGRDPEGRARRAGEARGPRRRRSRSASPTPPSASRTSCWRSRSRRNNVIPDGRRATDRESSAAAASGRKAWIPGQTLVRRE